MDLIVALADNGTIFAYSRHRKLTGLPDDIRAKLLDQDVNGVRQNMADQDIISLVFVLLRDRAYIKKVPLVEVPMFEFLRRLCEHGKYVLFDSVIQDISLTVSR